MTYRNHFHFDRHINDDIKSGGWRQLYPDDPNIIVSEFLGIIANNYDLEEEVEERLCLRYDTYPRGEKMTVTLGENELLLVRQIIKENGERRALTIDDLTLHQRLEAGTVVQEDIDCDSDCMRDVMPCIGAAIRQKMNCVPENETIILVMDNAGGHGMIEAIQQYTRHLLENYNIEIIHQPPRSPETNPLDLGVWRSIQSLVEKKLYHKTTVADALAQSVTEAWRHLPEDTISSVFGKVPEVLQKIIDDDGRNDLVEGRR